MIPTDVETWGEGDVTTSRGGDGNDFRVDGSYRTETLDQLETRWKRLDEKVRSSLHSVDLKSPITGQDTREKSPSTWTLRAFGSTARKTAQTTVQTTAQQEISRRETPADDEAIEHLVVGASELKADVADLLRERDTVRAEIDRERLLLASLERKRSDFEAGLARHEKDAAILSALKAEMDLASQSMNQLLNNILAKEAAVDAREAAAGELEEMMSRLELEADDLEDRLNEVSRREEALELREGEARRREEAVEAREAEVARREADASDRGARMEENEAKLADRTCHIEAREAEAALRELATERAELAIQEKAVEVAERHEAALRLKLEAEETMHEQQREKETVLERENRVIETEERLAGLQEALTARNMELMALNEATLAREAAAAESKVAAEERMDQARALEQESLAWKQRSEEAEAVLCDKEVVARHMRALREYSDALSDREFKLRESWDACVAQASALVDTEDTSMRFVVSPEAMDAIRRDAKLAEDLTSSSSSAGVPCAACTKHETRLQRWAVNLALETNALRARTERVAHAEACHRQEIAEAKANRETADALMSEISVKELELDCAVPALEAREKAIERKSAMLEEKERDLERALEKVARDALELSTRERALKALETRWEDRVAEVSSREQSMASMQRRMAEQRSTLESRELHVMEEEERLRVELIELADKRTKLQSAADSLKIAEQRVAERELDADTLLVEARRETELVREFEQDLALKFRRLGALALEIESREQGVVAGGGDLLCL